MAAGIILGSLVLPIEGSSPRNERNGKAKHLEMAAAAISRAKREHPPHPHLQLNIDGRRRGTNSSSPSSSSSASSSSKIGAAASSSSSSGGGGDDGGGGGDWEENLKKRLKDLEEMRELEKRAEELQSQLAAEGEEREETEEEKRERVRRELEKVAKEQAERRETAKLMFELGKKAYGKGMYARAIEFLEAALTIIPRPTLFGGEIQIWLAMAYEANNRHKDCIDLYRQLEKKHPVVSIRRQAAELRYILQAPKLKISKDEMVTIPLIGSSYDSYAGSWSDKYKDRGQRRKMVTTNPLPSSRDFFGDFMVFRPPSGWEENRYLWLFLAMWLSLIGTALLIQR